MSVTIFPVPGTIRTKARGSIVIGSSALSASATIPAVNLAKSRMVMTGWTSSSSVSPIGTDHPSLALASSTQITATRSTASAVVVTVNYELEEVY